MERVGTPKGIDLQLRLDCQVPPHLCIFFDKLTSGISSFHSYPSCALASSTATSLPPDYLVFYLSWVLSVSPRALHRP